jgi:hypothetical protein
LKVKYFFLPKSRKAEFNFAVAKNQHKLFSALIGAAKTWGNDHFRIADGFGTKAAEESEEAVAKEPMWKRALNYFFNRKKKNE